MKKLFLYTFLLCIIGTATGQENKTLQGSFIHREADKNVLWLFIDGYCSVTHFKNNEYIATMGGPFTYSEANGITIQVEYNDDDKQMIGTSLTTNIHYNDEALILEGKKILKKTNNNKQDLDGLWRITGRMENEKLATIPRADRKTIKILVDGYFQWIAINPATKGFYGTGGGTYTFANGKYTENILFFSRDNHRVGAQLSFKGSLENGEWQHSGKSSKGDDIYEIWSKDN
ncbi:hypothetical protein ORI89_09970 [Sphingobacterium sp. UT-1RO-CII-1]|uniref:hypothetical protein n=1 Tax=Sphingobacterium sp. UT-1RO-CII-1 TaxID=2995225 RepID=UPI00227D60B3|nr:hypothetical protein [Sphingobacterium sp. UT-1RO-CII-1]MCY4779977.1 hypothetical protein [Sphingobacterium sp. UT-1RO-CII-1]